MIERKMRSMKERGMEPLPSNYAEIANSVAWALYVGDRPCMGGECDLDDPCWRHNHTVQITDRYRRLLKRERDKS